MSRSPNNAERMYTADAATKNSVGAGIFINPGAPLTPFSHGITTARTTTRVSTANSLQGGNAFNFGKQIVQDFMHDKKLEAKLEQLELEQSCMISPNGGNVDYIQRKPKALSMSIKQQR